MKYTFYLFAMMLFPIHLQAQEVIGSLGGTYASASVSMEVTMGEFVINTEISSTAVLTQGFHQPELSVSGIEEATAVLSVGLYPNPTLNYVNIETTDFEKTNFQLRSIDGKILMSGTLMNQTTSLDLSSIERGVYTLVFFKEESQLELSIYKIIKQ